MSDEFRSSSIQVSLDIYIFLRFLFPAVFSFLSLQPSLFNYLFIYDNLLHLKIDLKKIDFTSAIQFCFPKQSLEALRS